MSHIDRLLRVAREAGAFVGQPAGEVEVSGKVFRKATIAVTDNRHAVELLNALAESDAEEDPKIAELGRMFKQDAYRKGESTEALARRILAFVQQTVTFAPEEGEKFRTSSLTLSMGVGDCDDSSRALAAISIAAGIPARVVLVQNSRGEDTHVAAQQWVDSQWRWAETTFPALWGESPTDAAKRLGLMREDVV